MRNWLSGNFLKIGVMALIVDLLNRFYFQIVMTWLTEAAGQRGATFFETMIYARVSTVLDLLATLLWGLFTLGFAVRVLDEFGKRGDDR